MYKTAGYTHVHPARIHGKPQEWIHLNTLIILIIFKLLTETPDPYNKDQQEDHKKILDLISDHFSSLIVL